MSNRIIIANGLTDKKWTSLSIIQHSDPVSINIPTSEFPIKSFFTINAAERNSNITTKKNKEAIHHE